MPPAAAQVTVTDSATSIVTADRHAVTVKNLGTVPVYVGAATVTTSTGYPVNPGESLAADIYSASALYGIVASGTCAVAVLRVTIQ